MNLVLVRNGLLISLVVLLVLFAIPSGQYVVFSQAPIPVSTYVSNAEGFYTAPVRYFTNMLSPVLFGSNVVDASLLSYGVSYVIPYSQRNPLTDYLAEDTDSNYYQEYLARSTQESEVYLQAAVLTYLNKFFELKGEGVVIGALTQQSELPFDQGQIITAIDGASIKTTQDLVYLLPLSEGDHLFTVDNEEILVTLSSPQLGLYGYTSNLSFASDEVMNISINGAFGSSGGLMIALALVNNELEEDLLQGRAIVGTGTILIDGSVLGVENIDLKIRGVEKKGFDLFILPRANIAEINPKDYEIELIPVDSLSEAVEELRT